MVLDATGCEESTVGCGSHVVGTDGGFVVAAGDFGVYYAVEECWEEEEGGERVGC